MASLRDRLKTLVAAATDRANTVVQKIKINDHIHKELLAILGLHSPVSDTNMEIRHAHMYFRNTFIKMGVEGWGIHRDII